MNVNMNPLKVDADLASDKPDLFTEDIVEFGHLRSKSKTLTWTQ